MKVENPPAFPLTDSKTFANDGMTLRDYFAGQALAGYIANSNDKSDMSKSDIAADCYGLADAMLKERLK